MSLERLRAQRMTTVWRDGSPMFQHSFGAIAAGAEEYVSMQTTFPASRAYEPLNNLVVTNTSGENVDIEINGQNYAMIPAGVIWSVDNQAIWSFRLTNISATNVAAGEIRANISRPPLGADELARLQTVGEAPF
tara:strand:+ start:386 stop:787 length:402 start_codon:yes stop_codon:yes gene_type:complete